jgi:uncharacterized protein (TIGR03435 family)
MKRTLIVCTVCLVAAAQPRPAFEVASVRTSLQEGPYRVTESVDADGIRFNNTALRLCILRAFGLKPYQIIGPDWIEQARYVINAKAAAPAPREKLMEMLQTLVADRFKLAFHRETREIPTYALLVAKNGPKLNPAKDDTVSEISGGTTAEFQGVTMQMLTNVIGNSLDRPVLDETGLNGRYDFKLTWAERKRKGPPKEGSGSDAPSIFTSLPAMLGLRLEPRHAPIEMFVIDHVERPSEN